jgi:hexosaminidase
MSLSLIPYPTQLELTRELFALTPQTHIAATPIAMPEAVKMATWMRPLTQLPLSFVDNVIENAISLTLDPALQAELGGEGYRMSVAHTGVTIVAAKPAGLFYAGQTLRQLLLSNATSLPGCVIIDKPQFAWRGLHVDCGRHFMPVNAIKKMIDALALHKMNVFHWHLTEDQGWRLEIKKYPRLTQVGAWRKHSRVGHEKDPITGAKGQNVFDAVPHGGFYTQAEAREVVAYAAERHITVVPEIEMPGHAQAAIAAYPELGNGAEPLEVCGHWGIIKHVFNVEDSTIAFLQDVLTEVLDIFPSPFIHVGGDECPKDEWRASPRAQAKMKALGLQDEHELQSWFIRQMDDFLTARGRRLVGWDEILEGGLARNATVMSWRGETGGITAAQAGHDVVMAPNTHLYFDYCQAQDKNSEPLSIGNFISVEKAYSYNPIHQNLNPEQAQHVLGAQAQLWTEYIPTPEHLEYMAFPRTCALAEVVWTAPEHRDFAEFSGRLTLHLERLAMLGINFRPNKAENTR